MEVQHRYIVTTDHSTGFTLGFDDCGDLNITQGTDNILVIENDVPAFMRQLNRLVEKERKPRAA